MKMLFSNDYDELGDESFDESKDIDNGKCSSNLNNEVNIEAGKEFVNNTGFNNTLNFLSNNNTELINCIDYWKNFNVKELEVN